MKHVLIAGGTGLLGKILQKRLQKDGHSVRVLTRSPRESHHVKWNPNQGELEMGSLKDTEVIINLCGAGIADKRWTKKRKEELINSRIEPAKTLLAHISHFPKLERYISASGINCYGFDRKNEPYEENEPYGKDFTSQLVQQWEKAANLFENHCTVVKLRIAVVLTPAGGAFPKLMKSIKMGLGAPLASGKQPFAWIHEKDLMEMFVHSLEKGLSGSYNAVGGMESNETVTRSLAKAMGKKLFLPKVPRWVLRMMLGEMSDLLVNGVEVSNEKVKKTGFTFAYESCDKAFDSLI